VYVYVLPDVLVSEYGYVGAPAAGGEQLGVHSKLYTCCAA
jgi:hypothetical protein